MRDEPGRLESWMDLMEFRDAVGRGGSYKRMKRFGKLYNKMMCVGRTSCDATGGTDDGMCDISKADRQCVRE